jgi:hypothetical protein
MLDKHPQSVYNDALEAYMQRIVLQKNQRFGRLKVIESKGVSAHGKSLYRCICDCGEEIIAIVSELKNGHTQSCGCLFRELRAEGVGSKTHGLTGTVEHIAWKNMHSRCRRDPDYAGRNIAVCECWTGENGFENFLSDIGPKPLEGHAKNGHALSVDRVNNDGNYEPGNVKWSTALQQRLNSRARRKYKKRKTKSGERIFILPPPNVS